MALRVPGGRPVWADHRRIRVRTTGCHGRPPVLERAIGATKVAPVEVTTDQTPVYPAVLEGLLPAAWHRTQRYPNNHIEADHGRLKARICPMRGLKQDLAPG